MHSFKDKDKRQWDIEITIGSALGIRPLLKEVHGDINLLEPESGDPPLLQRLGQDEILLVDVCFALLKWQADEAGVSDEQFARALDGKAALDMQKAFYDELIDFFRSRGRTDRAKAAVLQQKMIEQTIAKLDGRLEKINIETELDQIFTNLSGKSPE